MSKMASTDDIDELVSSVRDLVSHKEPPRSRSRILLDRLVLTPEQRVTDAETAKRPVNGGFKPAAPATARETLPPVQSYDKAGLEATIAELEAAVTAQFGDWEADEGESLGRAAWAASAFPDTKIDSAVATVTEPLFSNTPPSDDVVEPQSSDAKRAAEVAEDDANWPVSDVDKGALAASVLSGFDEKALRSLVVEIVHEELGGELGERITRNVRKMVRREINRVLTNLEMGQG